MESKTRATKSVEIALFPFFMIPRTALARSLRSLASNPQLHQSQLVVSPTANRRSTKLYHKTRTDQTLLYLLLLLLFAYGALLTTPSFCNFQIYYFCRQIVAEPTPAPHKVPSTPHKN